MFRKISENAESDSDGKKSKNLLEKTFKSLKNLIFGLAFRNGDSFDQFRDHKLYFMAFSKPLSR